jgi:hypothetical protein
MSSRSISFGYCALLITFFGLLLVPAAGAWMAPMSTPHPIPVNGRLTEPFEEDQYENGAEWGEPVTPASGSICRPEGYVDDHATFDEEIGPSWVLKSTNWFWFKGTGTPVVARIDGTWQVAEVVYEADEIPTAEDGVGCSGGFQSLPPRVEVDTKVGQRYLIQVGDWRPWSGDPAEAVTGASYTLSLATAAPNKYRSQAIGLTYGSPVQTGNFGGSLESPAPVCSPGERIYLGGRSVWAKVHVPSPGSLQVTLEQDGDNPGSFVMAMLYPQGSNTPIACAVGPFNPAAITTQLKSEVGPGDYSLQLMTAVKPDEDPAASAEELWQVTAEFSPASDMDGDGYAAPGDCDDNNAAIHPGALDLPDNGIDENCDGQDARRDSDNDGVPDYRDHCPEKSSEGIDSNGDGCRDPRQLQLTAQVRLMLDRSGLRLASLVVKSDPGARVVLECDEDACSGETKRLRGSRAPFDGTFAPHIPNGAEITLTATEAGYMGVIKRYRLSTAGMRLLRQWCTAPGKPGKKTPCG